MVLPTDNHISRIELATLDDRPRELARWDTTSGPLFNIPINLQGEAVGPENRLSWEQSLTPLVRLTLPVNQVPVFSRENSVVYLRNSAGTLLAEARFSD